MTPFFINPIDLALDGIVEKIVTNNTDTSSLTADQKIVYDQLKKWFRDLSQSTGIGNNLVQEVIDEITELEKANGRIKDGLVFTHSGFTAPILTAIEQEQYDVETVLIYEGPHPNYYQQFTNPNLKRIIHVMGSNHHNLDSILEGDAPVPFLNWAHFDNTAHDLENINIEIEGAWHSDYSYDPEVWVRTIQETYDKYISSDPAIADIFVQKKIEERERNRKVNLFMRDLYEASMVATKLESFLRRSDISRDPVTGVYKINLDVYQPKQR